MTGFWFPPCAYARTRKEVAFFQINGLFPIDLTFGFQSMARVSAFFGNINDLAILPFHRFERFDGK